MGTTFAPGQMAQLQTNVSIAIATALPNVAAKFEPKAVLKALEGRGAIFAGHVEMALEQALNTMVKSAFALLPRETVSGALAERHDPDAFFKTRQGLWVYDDYCTKIVARAKPVEANTFLKAESADLTRDLNDEEIEAALRADHLFEEGPLCALIAHLIANQANGEDGALLNNGYVNLFYTCSCVVGVRRSAGLREWLVSAWQRGDFRWAAGGRVFSPAN